jgi:hypothetical protein
MCIFLFLFFSFFSSIFGVGLGDWEILTETKRHFANIELGRHGEIREKARRNAMSCYFHFISIARLLLFA